MPSRGAATPITVILTTTSPADGWINGLIFAASASGDWVAESIKRTTSARRRREAGGVVCGGNPAGGRAPVVAWMDSSAD
jgi:hypothetical protein